MSTEALELALEALELAQDNLRPHGDNCFLHDEGEYNSCFCGKDSLADHLQSVVEKLDEALAQPQQEPVAWMSAKRDMTYLYGPYNADDIPLYTSPPASKPLTDDDIRRIANNAGLEPSEISGEVFYALRCVADEAAHNIKEST